MQGSARNESTKCIHLLAGSKLSNGIRLPLTRYQQCALFNCVSVLSCHPKGNNLFLSAFFSHLILKPYKCLLIRQQVQRCLPANGSSCGQEWKEGLDQDGKAPKIWAGSGRHLVTTSPFFQLAIIMKSFLTKGYPSIFFYFSSSPPHQLPTA